MTQIVGGLRARLIRESLYQMINTALDDLGWFDAGRPHQPVTFEASSKNQQEQIAMNTAALGDDNSSGEDIELGSQLSEERWFMYVDFYAESDALGVHFARDLKDILEGRITAIGRDDPSFTVYDWRQATPVSLFVCQIEEVAVDKAHGFLKPWLEHWYSTSFVVVDTYSRDDS